MQGTSLRDSRLATWIAIATVPVIAGLVIGTSGGIGVLPVLGLAVGVLFFFRPEYGLLLAAVTIPIENIFVFEGLTGTKVLSAVAIAAWLANRIVWQRPWGPLLHSRFVYVGAAFVGFALLSVLWAMVPRVAFAGTKSLLQLFVFALVVADVATPAFLTRLIRVLVVSGGVAAGITVQQYVMGAARAGEAVSGGINATATLMVTILALAFYMVRAERAVLWRAVGVAYIGLALVAVPVTLSRMNLLLLVAVLAVMVPLTFIGGRGRGWLAVLGLVGFLVGSAYVPWDRVGQRAETIIPYIQASLNRDVDNPVSSGRGYHLRVGLAIARDHPFIGVGFKNYGYYFLREYQFLVGGSEGLYYTPRSPHSSHIGILADLGLTGLVLWLTLLFGCALYYAASSWWMSIRKGLQNTRFLAESLLVAMALHAVPYALYQPNEMSKVFWLLFAMTFALHRIAKATEPRGVTAPDRPSMALAAR